MINQTSGHRDQLCRAVTPYLREHAELPGYVKKRADQQETDEDAHSRDTASEMFRQVQGCAAQHNSGSNTDAEQDEYRLTCSKFPRTIEYMELYLRTESLGPVDYE